MTADGGKATGERSATEKPETKSVNDTAADSPKDVFRRLGCYVVAMHANKIPDLRGHPKEMGTDGKPHFNMSANRAVQTEDSFRSVYEADAWSILPLKDSSLIILDQDSGTVNPALTRYFNRARRKYVSKTADIESLHGFLHVTDADHEWCAEFAKRFHKQIQGLEVFAEKHWVSYEGSFENPGDPTMRTAWYSLHDDRVVIPVRKEELEDVFGRLVPHASAGAMEVVRRRRGANRVPFHTAAGQGGRHMALIGLAFDVYSRLFMERKHAGQGRQGAGGGGYGGLITAQMMYDRIMADGRDRIEGVNEYENGQKRVELDNIIDYVLQQYDGGTTGGSNQAQNQQQLSLSMGRDVVADALQCAHIVNTAERNLQGREMYNCWYWDNGRKTWSPNTEFEIMRLLMTLQSDMLIPDSRMARRITESLAASEGTMMVDTQSEKYLNDQKHLIINTYGEYFDLRDGGIRRIGKGRLFFERPHMSVRFTGLVKPGNGDGTSDMEPGNDGGVAEEEEVESDEPVELDTTSKPDMVLRCMSLWFSERDMNILIDHMAGALLHTSILGDKPKMLYVVGRHDTFKSLWAALLSRIMHPSVVSSVPAVEISEKFGMSMIGERILNIREEQDPVRVDSPGNLKDAVTRIDGMVTQKYAISQIYVSRFPRHLIMCNMVQPIAQNDEDDSIFVRSQYITTRDRWDSAADETEARRTKWYDKIVYDDAEVRKFALMLMDRAHAIYNKKHEMNVMGVGESRRAYHKLMHGTFEEFIETQYVKVDASIGVLWRRIYNDYRKAAGSNIDYKKFKSVLIEAGIENGRVHCYRTDVKDVMSQVYTDWHAEQNLERIDSMQLVVVQGLIPAGNLPACVGGGTAVATDGLGQHSQAKPAAKDKTAAGGGLDGVEIGGGGSGAGMEHQQQPQQPAAGNGAKTTAANNDGQNAVEQPPARAATGRCAGCDCGHEDQAVCIIHECACCIRRIDGMPRHVGGGGGGGGAKPITGGNEPQAAATRQQQAGDTPANDVNPE